ncbi:MAG: twin-arginine translocation signal domain-containing protein, partial [Kiritimatiellae bacterium]|nr:twin-arginine translocation signal domain-containing protein [Kiritimatiellia bacterium]
MKRTAKRVAVPAARIGRRTFIKAGTAAAIGGACAMPSSAVADGAAPVVVVVHGTDPKKMVEAGIAKMGGWEKLFKPGAKVAIKPNLAWKSTPEQGGN